MKRFTEITCCTLILLFTGCSKADRDGASAQADQAAGQTKQATSEDMERAQAEAKKLGTQAKKLGNDIDRAVNSTGTATTTESASEKLQHASDTVKQGTASASQQLTKASLIAQMKTKLASDVGLSSVANVKVDVAGTIATLSGTVTSDQDRQRAEKAASQVSGVTKVVNELQVQAQ